MRGNCKSCGAQKAQFVSQKHGDGLLGKALGLKNNKVPFLGDIPLIGALF